MNGPYLNRPRFGVRFYMHDEYKITNITDPKWTPEILDAAPDVLQPNCMVYLRVGGKEFTCINICKALEEGYALDRSIEFKEGSPLMKALLKRGRYKVKLGEIEYVIYTYAKFSKFLEREGKRSINAHTRVLKRKLRESLKTQALSNKLIAEFSK